MFFTNYERHFERTSVVRLFVVVVNGLSGELE